jgi:hypothetical protein
MSKDDFTLPAGFVPLSDWDHRHRSGSDGHSAEYKTLRVAADSGKIQAFKMGGSGRWYVNRKAASEFLLSQIDAPATATKPKAKQPADRQYESVCESLADIASGIGNVVQLLERLASAVEQMAKHPLARLEDVGIVEQAGSWRDMNGEEMN